MLPLAVDLRGVRILAVGGGPVTARRVRTFVAEGARVDIVAPEVCSALQPLPEGVRWHARPFREDDLEIPCEEGLDAVRLVHTATGDPEVDGQVAELCAARGIWCVNATEAARGTAIVPARAAVDLPTGPVELSVTSTDPGRSVVVRNRIAHLLRTTPGLRSQRSHAGWVALVGGGPGDAGLLTVRGLTLVHSADVIVIDRLAPQGVLAQLDPDVIVLDVGKKRGHHPVPQAEINRLLIEHARAGRGVVRLKGGDPYVLGRGGEERLACLAAGIEVEVVPGVTSAVAVPAAAGIPVTHRGLARGFTVVTGHDVMLPGLPTGSDHTLVVLMGIKMLPGVVTRLLAQGRDPNCPSAIIERGSTPQQRVTVAPLGELVEVAARRGVQPPAVTVIGDVVTLCPEWADHGG